MSPTFIGRFNYLTFRPDAYYVLFTPMRGNQIQIIAKDLDRETAIDLMNGLNEQIDATRRHVFEEGEENG